MWFSLIPFHFVSTIFALGIIPTRVFRIFEVIKKVIPLHPLSTIPTNIAINTRTMVSIVIFYLKVYVFIFMLLLYNFSTVHASFGMIVFVVCNYFPVMDTSSTFPACHDPPPAVQSWRTVKRSVKRLNFSNVTPWATRPDDATAVRSRTSPVPDHGPWPVGARPGTPHWRAQCPRWGCGRPGCC